MEIAEGIRIVDLGVLIENGKTLVISDTQIGYDEHLHRAGVMLPRMHSVDMIDRLGRMIESSMPKKVIIAGDIKHEFGDITDSEWRYALRLFDRIRRRCDLMLIRGNHDTILEPIAAKRGIEMKPYHFEDGIFICHGHEIPDAKELRSARAVVIGHVHPALVLRDGMREERFKCFLKGRYRGADLIVLPSFNLFTEGSDVRRQSIGSPFIGDILGFEAIVAGDEPLRFGKLRDVPS